MKYKKCTECLCVTCAHTVCAESECHLCERLACGFEEVCPGYPNVKCPHYKSREDSEAKCICCGAAVPLGSVYCPNCLVSQLKR